MQREREKEQKTSFLITQKEKKENWCSSVQFITYHHHRKASLQWIVEKGDVHAGDLRKGRLEQQQLLLSAKGLELRQALAELDVLPAEHLADVDRLHDGLRLADDLVLRRDDEDAGRPLDGGNPLEFVVAQLEGVAACGRGGGDDGRGGDGGNCWGSRRELSVFFLKLLILLPLGKDELLKKNNQVLVF